MDVARCTLDGLTYQAVRFAALPLDELLRKRRFLVCSKCGHAAYFKKASCSGQAACFGARPHKSCSLAASEYGVNNNGLGDDQDILNNPGQRIVIDFDFGAEQTEKHNDPDVVNNVGGRGGRFVGYGARPDAVMHRRLSTLLRDLSTSEQFRTSRVALRIEGAGEFTVADFFIRFRDVKPTHDGQYHGYWGKLAHAGFQSETGALWLNTLSDDIGICVPEKFVSEFRQRFKISKMTKLERAGVLILGKLENSRNGKKYVPVADLNFITIDLT